MKEKKRKTTTKEKNEDTTPTEKGKGKRAEQQDREIPAGQGEASEENGVEAELRSLSLTGASAPRHHEERLGGHPRDEKASGRYRGIEPAAPIVMVSGR